jgi:predicted Zn-dependent peptidase
MRTYIVIVVTFVAVTTNVYADFESFHKSLDKMAKNVRYLVLSNGIRIAFYKRPISAPVFSGVVSVRVGGVDEPEGKTGLSHLFEHMAFKGTDTIGSTNYQQERKYLAEELLLRSKVALTPEERNRLRMIEQHLAKLGDGEAFTALLEEQGGVHVNATTSKELTSYFESLPKNRFEFWAWLESERILNPVYRQFFKERDVVLEERRMRYEDDPEGQLYEKLLNAAFTIHPYRNPVIGYEKDIKSLMPNHLDRLHEKYYVGNNIAIGIVGDIDPDEGIDIIREYFGRIPSGSTAKNSAGSKGTNMFSTKIPVEPIQTEEKSVRLYLDKEPLLVAAYHKPVYPHKDDAPITLLGEILSEGNTSILYEELVKLRHIASSIQYSEGPGFAYPNLFSFTITPLNPYSADQALRAYDQTIDRFLMIGVSEERLNVAKRHLAMEHIKELESNFLLAERLTSSILIHNRWDANLAWYQEMLHATSDDIMRVARTYLVPTNRTIGLIQKNGQSLVKSKIRKQ